MTITLTQAHEQGIAPWDDLVWQNDHVTVFRDRFPVTAGHMLFVPRIDTPQIIHRAMTEAQLEGDRLVAAGDCDGYNIGLNMGRAAGQTVMYPHVHLIPRRAGDCTDPTGGVRHVVPGQGNYHSNTYRSPLDN